MNVRAEQIKLALSKRHTDDFFMTEVTLYSEKKTYRMDALAMAKSWTNPCLYGYEVKVSRSDFLNDNKWPNYLASCNTFAFVCPKGLINKEELDESVGLYWYYPDSGTLVTQRKPKYRPVEIPARMYQYIIMSRIESDRYPFYSEKREFFEAWLQDKRERRLLGHHVAKKLQSEIVALNKIAEDAEHDKARYEHERQLLAEVTDVLKERGIMLNRWGGWQEELRQALAGGTRPGASRALNRLLTAANELNELLSENREEQS